MIILLFTLLSLRSSPENPTRFASFTYLEGSLPNLTGTLNIKIQPADQTDCKGNKSTFSVSAEGGTGKIHYLWKRKRPSEIDFTSFGAVDSTKLPVFNVGVGNEAPDGTLYQVFVSDAETEITSTSAHLTVNQITGIAPIGVASYSLSQGQNLWLRVQTSGNSPSGYQWIRKSGISNWPDVKDGSSVSGSQGSQLNFNEILPGDSGIYKIRVIFPTLNGNFCTETSAITRRIIVIAIPDTIPPVFINLFNISKSVCPEDLIHSEWDDSIGSAIKEDLVFFDFRNSGAIFDLTASHFSDNRTASDKLVLHWGMFSDMALLLAVMDEKGRVLTDQSGQISGHPDKIIIQGLSSAHQSWQIIFWLEDAAGNLTPLSKRHIVTLGILSRPEIESNF